jgi:hypothetical protein
MRFHLIAVSVTFVILSLILVSAHAYTVNSLCLNYVDGGTPCVSNAPAPLSNPCKPPTTGPGGKATCAGHCIMCVMQHPASYLYCAVIDIPGDGCIVQMENGTTKPATLPCGDKAQVDCTPDVLGQSCFCPLGAKGKEGDVCAVTLCTGTKHN